MVFYLYISLFVLVLPLKLITDDTSGTCIDASGTSGQVEMNCIYLLLILLLFNGFISKEIIWGRGLRSKLEISQKL